MFADDAVTAIVHSRIGVDGFYREAAASFQKGLERIEQAGLKDSAEWHLAAGLLRLAEGLEASQNDEDDRRKSFARSTDRN